MAENDNILIDGRREFDPDDKPGGGADQFVEVRVQAGELGAGALIYTNGQNTGRTAPSTLYFPLEQLTTAVIKLQKNGVQFPFHFELVAEDDGASLFRIEGDDRIDVTLEVGQMVFTAQFEGQKTTEPPDPIIPDEDIDCVEYMVQGLSYVELDPDELDPFRQPWVRIRYEDCAGQIREQYIEGAEIITAKLDTVEIVDGTGSIQLLTPTEDPDDEDIDVPDNVVVTVVVKGTERNIVIVNNGNVTDLNEGYNNLVYPLGKELQIKSSNLEETRIVWVRVFAPNQQDQELRANNGDSLEIDFDVQNKVTIEVNAEEVIIQQDIPTIQLDQTDDVTINLLDNEPLQLNILTDKTDVVSAFVKDEKFDTVVSYYNQDMETISSTIQIPQRVFSSLGQYKLILVPSNQFGAGEPLEVIVNVINEVRVPKPDLRNIRYPSKIKGPDFVGTDVDFGISWDADDTIDFVRIYFGDYYGNTEVLETTDSRIRLNVKDVLSKTADKLVDGKKHTFLIRLIPFSDQGIERVVGFEERLTIEFTEGDLSIPREEAINRIFDSFQNQLDTAVFTQSISNLLTHFLHLGDGDNKLISNWVGSEDSLVVKLYEPLPVTVQPNQQVWISKIQSNPIIETVTLTGRDEAYYPSLKGPNFSLEPDGRTGYKVYEELLNTEVDGTFNLVNKFTKGVGIDTEKLDIQYVADPYVDITEFEYTFDQFVHFGSAEEQVKNYIFKLEFLDSKGYDVTYLLQFVALGGENITYGKDDTEIINKTIQNFTGFENFLLLSNHTLNNKADWYPNLLQQAVDYDTTNVDYLVNNIPKHIIKDRDNSDFLLFLDMIGQHFDILWVYIKGISRIKKLEEKQTKGIANKLVYHLLQSFGWNSIKAYDTEQLWQYAFGLKSDGSQQENTYQNASNEVWRRILNNLPYLLKHKGTARSMKAITACYGVPNSLLTIMEFGGPTVRENGLPKKFTYEDRTASLNFQFGNEVEILWDEYDTTHPQAVELRINTQYRQPQTVLLNDGNWSLDIIPTTAEMGTLNLFVSGAGTLHSASTPQFPVFDNEYNQILINQSGSQFHIYGIQADAERIQQIVSASVDIADNDWDEGNELTLGGQFSGSIDEFRLWRVPLSLDKLENHALFPDAIDGNDIFSSTEDLIFRLDFERPQPLTINDTIKNVSINRIYAEEATANGFDNIEDYPWQYIPYTRSVTATVPSYGFTYSNKFRFEDVELTDELSHKKRATVGAFDRAPVDSNRLGLFLSPNKELNLDVIKSFGDGLRIDDLIGDPTDQYKTEYSGLKALRSYYFQRLDRNINEYVQLVKYIDQSMFDVLADLAPARAKVSKGLLIEPHILERSKVKRYKPEGEDATNEAVIDANEDIDINFWTQILDTILSVEETITTTVIKPSWDALIEADGVMNLLSDKLDYSATISIDDITLPAQYATLHINIDSSVSAETQQGENEAIPFTQTPFTHKTTNNIPFANYFVNGYFKSGHRALLMKRERVVNVKSRFSGREISGFDPGHIEVYPVTQSIYEVSLLSDIADIDLSQWNSVYDGNATINISSISYENDDPEFSYVGSSGAGDITSYSPITQNDLDLGVPITIEFNLELTDIGNVNPDQTGYDGGGDASLSNSEINGLRYIAIESQSGEVYIIVDPIGGLELFSFQASFGANSAEISLISTPNLGDSPVLTPQEYNAILDELTRFYRDLLNGDITTVKLYYLTENEMSIFVEGPTIDVGGDIVSVEPIDGYYRTHYRYTSSTRHWTSLQNLYYLGCKQTDDTTPDGLPAVQSFTTNPNILRVADTGRGSGEPLLTVD